MWTSQHAEVAGAIISILLMKKQPRNVEKSFSEVIENQEQLLIVPPPIGCDYPSAGLPMDLDLDDFLHPHLSGFVAKPQTSADWTPSDAIRRCLGTRR
jgi:hypothetical protein